MLDKTELAKSIAQELAKSGHVPQEFLHKDNLTQATDLPDDFWRETLLIDFSLLSLSSPAADTELAKLHSALSNWGYFQVKNHGIEDSFLGQVMKVSKEFFGLPLEEKIKCHSPDEKVQGYGNNLGPSTTKTNYSYWRDTLFFSLHPEANRKLKLWPANPQKFSTTIDEYSKKLVTLSEGIYKAMARSLKLEEDVFLKYQGKERAMSCGFNYYPPCSSPDRVLGVHPHSDGTNLTILLPDKEVAGLQVQKDDEWYNVPIIPGALVINLGDLGEVMTNGIYKSVMLRVVTNTEKERMSVAAFFTSEANRDVGPVPELINDEHPQRYKKFNSDEFTFTSRRQRELQLLML